MALFLRVIRVFMGMMAVIFAYIKTYLIFNDSEDVNWNEEDVVKVLRVTDGDTFLVGGGKGEYKVRLIGVDTPETVHPNKDTEFFGEEAKVKIREMLLGEEVTLFRDRSQGDIDKYGRKLRYLFLGNGVNFNKWLISKGYAHEYTYQKSKPYKFQREFVEAEKKAKSRKTGIWSDELYGKFLIKKVVDFMGSI